VRGVAGTWFIKSDVEERLGISAIQLRNELSALSKLTKRLFGQTIWPMEYKKEQGSYYYRMGDKVARWWHSSRRLSDSRSGETNHTEQPSAVPCAFAFDTPLLEGGTIQWPILTIRPCSGHRLPSDRHAGDRQRRLSALRSLPPPGDLFHHAQPSGVPVPDDDVDRLWEEAIARNTTTVELAYDWPYSREVGWCPHCIVKHVSDDQTPAALSAAKARAEAENPPCGLPELHARRLCGCDDA
jgi:hypothetical protein